MRILFVDNHPEFTSVVTAAFLSKHDVVIVPTVVAARAAIESSAFDLALVDYDLDDGKGDEFVRWVRTTMGSLPIIAVSSHSTGNDGLVRAGADRVCGKLEFSKIATVIDGLVSRDT